MHSRVVPIAKAKKLLSGHKSYIERLEWEYANPNADGGLNSIIEEYDAEVNGNDEDFNDLIFSFMEEMGGNNEERFVLLAMLGDDPDESHWA